MMGWDLPSGYDRLPSGIEPDAGIWLPPLPYDGQVWSPRVICDEPPPIPWYSWATLAGIGFTVIAGAIYAVVAVVRGLS